MKINNPNELKIGMKIWFYSKYGDLESGTILKLNLNYFTSEYHKEIGESFDSVIITHPNYPDNRNISKSICAKQTQIYLDIPEDEFIDERVEFSSDCINDDCDGTINGLGWCDDDGVLVKFDYQECNTCDFNQGS